MYIEVYLLLLMYIATCVSVQKFPQWYTRGTRILFSCLSAVPVCESSRLSRRLVQGRFVNSGELVTVASTSCGWGSAWLWLACCYGLVTSLNFHFQEVMKTSWVLLSFMKIFFEALLLFLFSKAKLYLVFISWDHLLLVHQSRLHQTHCNCSHIKTF